MKLIEIIASAIGKIWSLCSIILVIALLAGIIIFGLTVFMPDNVLRAIDIIKGLIP